jgi:hypothetical protein
MGVTYVYKNFGKGIIYSGKNFMVEACCWKQILKCFKIHEKYREKKFSVENWFFSDKSKECRDFDPSGISSCSNSAYNLLEARAWVENWHSRVGNGGINFDLNYSV